MQVFCVCGFFVCLLINCGIFLADQWAVVPALDFVVLEKKNIKPRVVLAS